MKKLDEFQAKNHKDIKYINENNQATFKGGRILSGGFMNMEKPIQVAIKKPSPFTGAKFFSSFANWRASMFGGK